MDHWMIDRNTFPGGLLGLFSALDELQDQYDWVISDTDLYFQSDAPEAVLKRWQWTGLMMTGAELAGHIREGHVWMISGAFSAVPKGSNLKEVQDYLPSWEVNFDAPEYAYQTPLTQLEIFCYDGYAYVINCDSELSKKIRQALPCACPPKQFYQK